MDRGTKRSMSTNNFGIIFPLLYFPYIILIYLHPEMRRFAYSGIIQEDCEETLCFYPLGEARVAASRLISAGFCTILEWITWWLQPRLWYHSPVEGLGVYEIASITCTDTGSYVIPLGAD